VRPGVADGRERRARARTEDGVLRDQRAVEVDRERGDAPREAVREGEGR
jgi:hypothetical protein